MAKGPFHFKEFSVQQDGAAMKVGTDGIVLGCWTDIDTDQVIMDVGAGNGYIGIMLLQRATTKVHLIGVELEPGAARQAMENYGTQPFQSHTTEAWLGAFQSFPSKQPQWKGKIDLIVSNPPFFRDKPKSPIQARNLARHDDSLPMGDLVKTAAQLLRPGGRLCTIWPHDRMSEWNQWALSSGFISTKLVHIKTMRHLPPKRVLSEWTLSGGGEEHPTKTEESLTLEGQATLDFTPEYLDIVRPYLRGT